MYAGSPGTLDWAKKRPVFQRRNFASTKMSDIAKIIAKHDKEHAPIDEQAALFYLSSHIFHLIEGAAASSAGQIHPDHLDFVEEHIQRLNKLGVRMFSYLCVISAEEACFGRARNDGIWDFIESSTSADAAKWIREIVTGRKGSGYFSGTGAATIGECLKAVEMMFRFAQWTPGFGGLPWAQITQTAQEAAEGVSSLELCVDKAFTLCHNNGAIFNKHHVFGHYSGSFYHLLDIQASGQIPGAIAAGIAVDGLKAASVKALCKRGKELFPEEFAKKYEPSKVKSMEAVREAKEKALAKKAAAFFSSASAAPAPTSPPKRPCDDLITLDQLQDIHKSVKNKF